MKKICPICGKEFEDKHHKKKVYCSNKCSNVAKRKIGIGQRFGRLVVLKEIEPYVSPKGYKKIQFLCQCDCGNTTIVVGTQLRSGKTKSCGCIRKETASENSKAKAFIPLGSRGNPLYHIWTGMKDRCFNPNGKNKSRYMSRGITVCEEWKSDFMNFYNWAIANGYQEGLSIDRINNNGNYEPSNCRWATAKEQANNRGNTRFVEYREITKPLAFWCDELGLDYNKTLSRIHELSWDIDKAFKK